MDCNNSTNDDYFIDKYNLKEIRNYSPKKIFDIREGDIVIHSGWNKFTRNYNIYTNIGICVESYNYKNVNDNKYMYVNTDINNDTHRSIDLYRYDEDNKKYIHNVDYIEKNIMYGKQPEFGTIKLAGIHNLQNTSTLYDLHYVNKECAFNCYVDMNQKISVYRLNNNNNNNNNEQIKKNAVNIAKRLTQYKISESMMPNCFYWFYSKKLNKIQIYDNIQKYTKIDDSLTNYPVLMNAPSFVINSYQIALGVNDKQPKCISCKDDINWNNIETHMNINPYNMYISNLETFLKKNWLTVYENEHYWHTTRELLYPTSEIEYTFNKDCLTVSDVYFNK